MSPTITIRILAICSLIAGLVVVWVLGVALQSSPETTAATAAQCIDRSALARFQLARSTDDLLAVFGPPDSPCRPLVHDALEATQRADLHGLIPAYALFFIAGGFALAGPRSRWTWVATIATLVAAVANVIEDSIQLAIIQSVDQAAGLLAPLEIATQSKFTGLAVCASAFGAWALGRRDRRWPLAVVGLLPLPATLIAALDPQRLGFLMAITFLVFAVALFGTEFYVLMRPQWAKR
jgi:hypothetical protein